jgi:hypothetical protein
MQTIDVERRTFNRRVSRGGGRRATDMPLVPGTSPMCPSCLKCGVSLLAGEAEGGWWFVCLACDHLWDERQHNTNPEKRAEGWLLR